MGILRLWLAICVVIAHSSPVLGLETLGGGSAVATFFVLAGFLAMHVIEGKYQGRYLAFYVNRAIRIWPLYWAVLAGTAALLAFALWWNGTALGAMQVWAMLLNFPADGWMLAFALSQAFCVGQELLNFVTISAAGNLFWGCPQAAYGVPVISVFFMNLVPQAWSLAIEEYFYASVPLVRRLGLVFAGLLFTLGLLLSSLPESCNYAIGFYPPTMLFFFGGIFAYRLYQSGAIERIWGALAHRNISAAFLAYVFLAPFAPGALPRSLTVALAALALPSMFATFKDKAWDRYLGDLSYPLYLVHLTVLWGFNFAWPWFKERYPVGYAVVPLSLLAAVVAAHLVERPLRRYRERLLARAVAQTA